MSIVPQTRQNTELLFQCDLSQGTGRQTAYIPERGAKVGKLVELEPGSGDFWTVDLVGVPGQPAYRVKALQDDHHKGFASI